MLYAAYQGADDLFAPLRAAAIFGLSFSPRGKGPLAGMMRRTAAILEMTSRFQLTHDRPPFHIDAVRVESCRDGMSRRGPPASQHAVAKLRPRVGGRR